MKVGVLQFPGTNCDQDCVEWVTQVGGQAKKLWHLEQFSPLEFDLIILPGGFSYGDYLRSGALAAHSPIITSLRTAAESGVRILGICNGFQILCETGLLPGVLLQNSQGRFVDQWVELEVIESSWKSIKARTHKIRLPVAHGDGRYFVDSETLKSLQDSNQIWLKYTTDINGSLNQIAGVTNRQKNVFGLMPHPERALSDWMGSSDGLEFLK